MAYIYNITFVISPDDEEAFLEWMRNHAMPNLFVPGSAARNPRLQTVVEAGGERPGPEHGLSMALQAEFETEELARDWHDNALPDVLGHYHSRFGDNALFFITLLKVFRL